MPAVGARSPWWGAAFSQPRDASPGGGVDRRFLAVKLKQAVWGSREGCCASRRGPGKQGGGRLYSSVPLLRAQPYLQAALKPLAPQGVAWKGRFGLLPRLGETPAAPKSSAKGKAARRGAEVRAAPDPMPLFPGRLCVGTSATRGHRGSPGPV